MQKRSHKLLASALLSSRRGFDARRYEWAFLFGSFQPDCNPFSYLRGFRQGKTFGGHNYSNSRCYIDAQIEKNASDFVKLTELSLLKEKTERELAEAEERWLYLTDLAERIEAQKKD